MDAKYVEPLVVEGQIDEEHLVEAPLADHLRGQEVYAVGGGAHEQPARLLLHPRQEEAEDAAQLAFLGLRVDPGLDLVEPDHRRRHRLEHVAGVREGAFGRPVTSGEDRDHVDAIERQLEAGRDRLDGQTLAAARDAHDQHPFGHDLGADAVSHLEQLAPLHQPLLHERQSADVLDAGLGGEVLDHAGAVHQHALPFEERRNRFLIQDRARAERATNRMARLVERQALKSASELEEGGLVGIETAAGRRDHRRLAPQKPDQLVEIGNRQLDVDDGALDLLGDELDRRADDQDLATVEAELVQVAQPPTDVRRLPHRLVVVLEQKERPAIVGGDEIESGTRPEQLAAGSVVAAHAFGEAPCPERDRRREAPARDLAQERRHALLFRGTNVGQRSSRFDDVDEGAERAALGRIYHWSAVYLEVHRRAPRALLSTARGAPGS